MGPATDDRGCGGDQLATLGQLLVAAADTYGDRPAIVDGDVIVDWRQYELSTRRLAEELVAAGIEPGDRVAVAAFMSRWAYVAAHAAVRAGAVFVPIDPLSPPAAQYQVLANCRPRAIIAGTVPLGRLHRFLSEDDNDLAPDPVTSALIWECDPTPSNLDAERAWSTRGDVATVVGDPAPVERTTPLPTMSPTDPAYLIHTSGSTGVPKGILHSHASALAYATRAAEYRKLGPDDRVAGMAPFHFDTSTFELWAAPVAGAAVVVIPETHMRMPASFAALTARERTTVWYGVPSFFQQLTERGAMGDHDHSALRLVMFAGEPYPPETLARFMGLVPGAVFENIYGPAEVNECTAYTMPAPPGPGDDIPIGATWRGVAGELMTEQGEPVPPGERGELWIDAPTAMIGYWNNPEATAARMVTIDGVRWCRTGDLCDRDDDGNFVFRGRLDNQVKVRGARIELEAVEGVVNDAPGVLHAVVGPSGGDRGLVASIVADPGVQLDERALRRYCAVRLASVAVPERFRVVATFPLTQSGKIDRTTVRRQLREWVEAQDDDD